MCHLIYKYLENLFLSTNLGIKESKIINNVFLKCLDNKYSLSNGTTTLILCYIAILCFQRYEYINKSWRLFMAFFQYRLGAVANLCCGIYTGLDPLESLPWRALHLQAQVPSETIGLNTTTTNNNNNNIAKIN